MEHLYKLREIDLADLSTINSWRNDKSVMDLLGNNFLYIANAVDEAWFEGYLRARSSNVRLAIVSRGSGETIGTVQLTDIHPVNRSAEFSIMIGAKEYWSMGVGTFVTRQVVDHGFRDLNLNRIHLTAVEYNKRAIRTYEKVGFRSEGVLRQAIFKNGNFVDLIEMAILRTEWEQIVDMR